MYFVSEIYPVTKATQLRQINRGLLSEDKDIASITRTKWKARITATSHGKPLAIQLWKLIFNR